MPRKHLATCARLWAVTVAAVVLCALEDALAAEGAPPSRYGDVGQAVVTLVIFAALVAVLGKWVWKPVLAQLHRRETEIRERIQDTERRDKEAKDLEAHYRARIERAEADAEQVVLKGREDADRHRKEAVASAREEARDVLDQAMEELEEVKVKALRDLQQTTAELAVHIAGQLLQKELSPAEHTRLMREAMSLIRQKVEKEV